MLEWSDCKLETKKRKSDCSWSDVYKQITGDEEGHMKEACIRLLLLSPHRSSPVSSQVKAQFSHASLSQESSSQKEGIGLRLLKRLLQCSSIHFLYTALSKGRP